MFSGVVYYIFSVEKMTINHAAKPVKIQALGRASAIMDVIATGDSGGVGLTEISRATSLNKTTTFNLIASLVTLGFLEQDEQTRFYRLGLRNLELGRTVQRRLHIAPLARPILVDLCKKTNETVNLGVPDMLDLLVIDSFQGSQQLHATSYLGWRSMYHCTALGKAMMAYWEESMRNTVFRLSGLPKKTSNTMTNAEKLEIELKKYRSLGYAVDFQENEIGINGIAAPVIDGMGEVAAAVSIAGPATRLTKKTVEIFSKEVVNAARVISLSLRQGPSKSRSTMTFRTR